MLERVPSSAECAAHIFIRQLEAPLRSSRSLDPSFWRHRTVSVDAPAWWPLYLEGVRSRQPVPNDAVYNINSPPTLITTRSYKRSSGKSTSRNLSTSSSRPQAAAVPVAFKPFARPVDSRVPQSGGLKEQNVRASGAEADPVGEPVKYVPISARRIFDRRKAWDEFVRAGFDETHASTLLSKFAAGKSRGELKRTLRTFQFIPPHLRTAEDYRTAVDVSLRLNKHSVAIPLIKEAVQKSVGEGIFYELLALCISKNLWLTAVDLWIQVDSRRSYVTEAADQSIDIRTKNFAGKYAFHFDLIADLPSKLVELATRLQQNDPAFSHNSNNLRELCMSLVQLCVENERVIRIITTTGMLSLFTTWHELGGGSELHFDTLATIGRLQDKDTKCQLAFVVYNNFKFRYPDKSIPKWVIGTMIGICSAARQPPNVYHGLLNDYRSFYGTPEDGIYLRIMRACATQGEVEDLHTIFADFCEHTNPKHVDQLTPLVRVHAVVGDWQKAQAAFDTISPEYDLRPNVKTWNALLLAYSRSNQTVTAYRKFEEMRRSGVQPDEYSWSILVAVASKRGDTEHARVLVEKAQAAGISPPFAMTGAVVDSLLLNDNASEAYKVIYEATISNHRLKESPIRLWNSLYRYYAFRADSEAILQTQANMKLLHVKADGMTYAALMTALVVQRRTEDALKILRTLHFSQQLSANEFHYSILIHGFAMEKKVELASVLFQEMLQYFPRATPSAKLSMLHVEALRAEERATTAYLSGQDHRRPDFRGVSEKIEHYLSEIKPSDLASRIPNPGFKRKSSHADMDTTFLGSLMTFLQRNNAYGPSAEIAQVFKTRNDSNELRGSVERVSWISSIEQSLLALNISVSTEDWSSVDQVWQEILETALSNCLPTDVSLLSGRRAVYPHTAHSLEFEASKLSGFKSMIAAPPVATSPDTTVLPAHQFVLSRPLSQYLKALDQQHDFQRMVQTIREVQKYGFQLSSKNWNGYIQALCRSPNIEHSILAFGLFDKYLRPRAPSWNTIRRGVWVRPRAEKSRDPRQRSKKPNDGRKSRKLLEQLEPGLLMPTYYTMVHLAIVWMRALRLANEGELYLREQLELYTPKTVKLVLRTPHLRDRVQGVLLRGLTTIGDRVGSIRKDPKIWGFAGVQGSQLLLDQIPEDLSAYLQEKYVIHDKIVTDDDLADAERITGEINSSPLVLPSLDRFETRAERDARIEKTKVQKIDVLKGLVAQMRMEDQLLTPLVGTVTRGLPPVGSPAFPAPGSIDSEGHISSSLQTPAASNAQLDRQYLLMLVDIQKILKTVSETPLYEKSTLRASRQRPPVRTNSLIHRQGLRLHLPKRTGTGLVTRPQRIPRSKEALESGSAEAMIKPESPELGKWEEEELKILTRRVDSHSRLRDRLEDEKAEKAFVSRAFKLRLATTKRKLQTAVRQFRRIERQRSNFRAITSPTVSAAT